MIVHKRRSPTVRYQLWARPMTHMYAYYYCTQYTESHSQPDLGLMTVT